MLITAFFTSSASTPPITTKPKQVKTSPTIYSLFGTAGLSSDHLLIFLNTCLWGGIQEGPASRPADRLANCLSSIAFPAVQAALSTILCVCSLLFVNLYMAQVFVKIMVLCVVLCNLHGLVFLPAILIMADSIRWAFRPKGAAAQAKAQAARTRRTGKVVPERIFVVDRPAA